MKVISMVDLVEKLLKDAGKIEFQEVCAEPENIAQ